MNSKEIITYLAVKYNGDWDQIYEYILSHRSEDGTIIREDLDEKEAKEMIRNIHSKVITILDDDYPDSLKTCTKPPFAIFYHGDIKLLDCKMKAVSVVGARVHSFYGERATREIVTDLAKEVTIVSGMAKGIDSIAHWAAINAGGKTIAVLGSGINYIYPTDNKDLYQEIKKNHLVVSEYPDKTPPTMKSFPARNRIIAGLTNCCFVPEAKNKSGTSITVSLMLRNFGYVCCVPTLIGRDSLCNTLISEGARLTETADDIFDEMGYQKHEPEF